MYLVCIFHFMVLMGCGIYSTPVNSASLTLLYATSLHLQATVHMHVALYSSHLMPLHFNNLCGMFHVNLRNLSHNWTSKVFRHFG